MKLYLLLIEVKAVEYIVKVIIYELMILMWGSIANLFVNSLAGLNIKGEDFAVIFLNH